MFRYTLILILCTYSFALSSQIQFDLEAIAKKYLKTEFTVSGQVLDGKTGEPIIFASIALFSKDGVLIAGTETDLDGKYSLQIVDAGTYYIESSFIGYSTTRVTGIEIARSIFNLNILLEDQVIFCGTYYPRYIKPLIRQDDTTSGKIMMASEIRNMR